MPRLTATPSLFFALLGPSVLAYPACKPPAPTRDPATSAPLKSDASPAETRPTQPSSFPAELVGTWRLVAEEGNASAAQSDELIILSDQGDFLYALGSGEAYPGEGPALIEAAEQVGWGSWEAEAGVLSVAMLTGGEQAAFDLPYTLDDKGMSIPFGREGAMATYTRLATEAPTVPLSHGMEFLETEAELDFVVPYGWSAMGIPPQPGQPRSAAAASGQKSQRVLFAAFTLPEGGDGRQLSLDFSAGAINKLTDADQRYVATPGGQGCGLVGDHAFAAQVPGYLIAESVWKVHPGWVAGVLCLVAEGAPDHFDLIPAMANTLDFRGELVFPEQD